VLIKLKENTMNYKLKNNDLDFLRNLIRNSSNIWDDARYMYFGDGHFALSTDYYGDTIKKGFDSSPALVTSVWNHVDGNVYSTADDAIWNTTSNSYARADYKILMNLKRKKVLSNVHMDDGNFHITLDLDYLPVIMADGFADSKTDNYPRVIVKDIFANPDV